jgi:hypothetical protein
VCDDMLQGSERPTKEKLRKVLGGSPKTLATLLVICFDNFGERLERGTTAFKRIPARLALNVEEFFLTLLDEARARAEHDARHDAAAKLEAQVSLRDHLLALHEEEMNAFLEQRNHIFRLLEKEITEKRAMRSQRSLMVVNDQPAN